VSSFTRVLTAPPCYNVIHSLIEFFAEFRVPVLGFIPVVANDEHIRIYIWLVTLLDARRRHSAAISLKNWKANLLSSSSHSTSPRYLRYH